MLDCFLAASCTSNDSNLCKSSSICGQVVRNHRFLFFFLLFDGCSSATKYFDLFLTYVEMMFLGTPYFQRRLCFRDIFLGLSEPDILRLNSLI